MKHLNRRQFTQTALASSAASLLGQQLPAAKRRRPNVLFVMGDEWRAQAFGYAGDPNAHTPTIDRFATESVNFEQMISCLPVCCPARASLLTGQYPLTHGVYINDVPLIPKGKTMGEVFRDAGYATGYIGKWHLYGSPDGMYGRRESYIPPDKRFGFEYWKAAECCHDYNRSFYYEGNDPTKKYWPGYDAEAQTNDACQFIRDHANRHDPYLLVLSWGPPHFPLHSAPQQYQDIYKDRPLALRPNVAPDKKEEAISDLRGYYAHIAALDDCFAKLLNTVDATGQREDTIIIFTSDHGDMMRSQGLVTKLYPWEESARVPLLVRYPGKYGRTGRRSEELIGTPDIMPMLLSLCDLPTPRGVQGTDFSGLGATRRTIGSSTTAFLHMPVPITTARNFGIAEYRGVRNARYTYVRSIKGPWLLYDNQQDPYQMKNLCNKKEAANIQLALDKELDIWLKELGDQFLPAERYLERDHLTNYMEPYAPVTFTRSPWNDWQSTLVVEPLSVDAPLQNLYDDPQARAIIEREITGIDRDEFKKHAATLSLRELEHTRLHIPRDVFRKVDRLLGNAEMSPG